jgi:hypothetical protein
MLPVLVISTVGAFIALAGLYLSFCASVHPGFI